MTLYETLEVDGTASSEVITKAYRRLARKYHPDRNPGDEEAAGLFKKISEAYEVLNDPEKRSRYDRVGSTDGGCSQIQQWIRSCLEKSLRNALAKIIKEHGDTRYQNLLSMMHQDLAQAVIDTHTGIETCQEASGQIKAAKARFSIRIPIVGADEGNMLEQFLDNELIMADSALKDQENQLKVLNEAKEELNRWFYKVDVYSKRYGSDARRSDEEKNIGNIIKTIGFFRWSPQDGEE